MFKCLMLVRPPPPAISVLYQFLEAGKSDRCLICIVQNLRFSYPLSFFIYSPFNSESCTKLVPSASKTFTAKFIGTSNIYFFASRICNRINPTSYRLQFCQQNCEPYTIIIPVAMSSISDNLHPPSPSQSENTASLSKPNICRPVYTHINKISHVEKYGLKSKYRR